MARPLRIQYPGAWYHIMNRGTSHQKIFLNDDDKNTFLNLLGTGVWKGDQAGISPLGKDWMRLPRNFVVNFK